MLHYHSLVVDIMGDEVRTRFFKNTRAGKVLVGVCQVKKDDKDVVVAAIEKEHAAVLVGTGKRSM